MVERKRRRKSGGRSSKVAARQSKTTEYSAFIERKVPYFEILSEEGLSLIENNADILLEEIGVEFHDFPEALKLFKDAGADVMVYESVFHVVFAGASFNQMLHQNSRNMQEIPSAMLL